MKKKFYGSLIALIAVASGMLLFNVFNTNSQAALPRDCDNNSIIYCGAGDAGELNQKYNENKTGDLPAVYGAYGITAADIANGKGQMGLAHKDGRVTVNGETVATNSMSIGRQSMAGSTPKVIAGKTYYNSPSSTAFMSESIATFVFFDANGQFKAAIITSCGNSLEGIPVPPKKPAPSYKCVILTADKINRNEYTFKATAEAKDGATVTGYRYEFGDGKAENSSAATIKHTYEKSGTYIAKLSVDVKVNNETKTVTASECQVNVAVEAEPVYKCDSLTVRTIKLEDRTYAFDLAYTATGGAILKTVDYAFGDGQGREGVSPEEAKTVMHSYVKAGSYTTTATLHFTTDESTTVQDAKCRVTITTSPEMCALNPSLPKDDARCAPCAIPGKEQYPKDSPLCVTPHVTELPKTGPMDLIGGGIGLSSLVAASYYWYASRRGLLAAWLER